jgi:hypothetical protein
LLIRSERRRKVREHVASRPEMERQKLSGVEVVSDEEFIATLSPAERTFCIEVLFAANQSRGELEYSRGNRWQLRHRIRKKLEYYLR